MNNLCNKQYGRLVALQEHGRSNDRHILWRCVCDCGNECVVSSKDLVSGHTMSCGCYAKEQTSKARIVHGGSGNHHNIERLYMVWVGMRKRCNTKTDRSYKYYGALGVSVCKEWDNYATFKQWALNNGYDKTAKFGKCTIDRINVYGNYEPSNCRWVDMSIQNRNKRSTKMGGGEQP